jgi:hypothetical protein
LVCTCLIMCWFTCSLTDTPSYDVPGKSIPKEDRRKWLLELCVQHVNKFLLNFQVDPLLQQMQYLHNEVSSHEFLCRVEGCTMKYVHHSMRVKWVTFGYVICTGLHTTRTWKINKFRQLSNHHLFHNLMLVVVYNIFSVLYITWSK